ncbi:dihydrofolate reductase family protein [Micromonospora sp. M12]
MLAGSAPCSPTTPADRSQPAGRQPGHPAAAAGGGGQLGAYPADALVRDGAARTWIATADEVGAGPDGRVDLSALLAALHQRGIRAVLLEGGPGWPARS